MSLFKNRFISLNVLRTVLTSGAVPLSSICLMAILRLSWCFGLGFAAVELV